MGTGCINKKENKNDHKKIAWHYDDSCNPHLYVFPMCYGNECCSVSTVWNRILPKEQNYTKNIIVS